MCLSFGVVRVGCSGVGRGGRLRRGRGVARNGGGREDGTIGGGWEVGEDAEHREDGCEDGRFCGWVDGMHTCVQ